VPRCGLHALPLVFGCIAVELASVLWLGNRLGFAAAVLVGGVSILLLNLLGRVMTFS
jgi:hypothetical protein